MQIERKCINCTSFPCMKEECKTNNVCKQHKFEHEKIIEEKEVELMEFENIFKTYEPKSRENRSALQFNGDTFFTLYTETKFNKFQKFLWKHLLNIKIIDMEE